LKPSSNSISTWRNGPGDHDRQRRSLRIPHSVEWIKTAPRDRAIREKEIFSNRNTAVGFRDQFTLERLVESFGLGEGEGA